MFKFAVLDGNKVTNIIWAESLEVAEEVTGTTCIQSWDASMFATYDAETGEFTAYVEPAIEESLTIEAPAE